MNGYISDIKEVKEVFRQLDPSWSIVGTNRTLVVSGVCTTLPSL